MLQSNAKGRDGVSGVDSIWNKESWIVKSGLHDTKMEATRLATSHPTAFIGNSMVPPSPVMAMTACDRKSA